MIKQFRHVFYALSNAAYRVSLHGPGAELERGVQTPLARHVQRGAGARRGLKNEKRKHPSHSLSPVLAEFYGTQ